MTIRNLLTLVLFVEKQGRAPYVLFETSFEA